MALTKRQREVFDIIREFIAANGYSPSLEEIGRRSDSPRSPRFTST